MQNMLQRSLILPRFRLPLAAVLLVLVLGALILRQRDEPISEASLRVSVMCQSRPPLADADNAYVYLLGFGAAPADSPLRLGQERMSRVRVAMSAPGGRPDALFASQHEAGEGHAFQPCRTNAAGTVCEAVHLPTTAQTQAALATHGWLLARYMALLAYPDWQEPIPVAGRLPPMPPDLPQVAQAQQLFLEMVALRFREAAHDEAREWLQRDLMFWRRVLARTESLALKRLAQQAVVRHFRLGHAALLAIPPESLPRALPSTWHVEMQVEERALGWSLIGEYWRLGEAIESTRSGVPTAWRGHEPSVLSYLGRPLLQEQATRNAAAAAYLDLMEASRRALPELSAALQTFDAAQQRWQGGFLAVRNLYGRALLADRMQGLSSLARELAQLEGVRLAALHSARLRAGSRVAPQAWPSYPGLYALSQSAAGEGSAAVELQRAGGAGIRFAF